MPGYAGSGFQVTAIAQVFGDTGLEAPGLLLQMDGSTHRWFGNKKTCLIAIIDDASSEVHGKFFAFETHSVRIPGPAIVPRTHSNIWFSGVNFYKAGSSYYFDYSYTKGDTINAYMRKR